MLIKTRKNVSRYWALQDYLLQRARNLRHFTYFSQTPSSHLTTECIQYTHLREFPSKQKLSLRCHVPCDRCRLHEFRGVVIVEIIIKAAAILYSNVKWTIDTRRFFRRSVVFLRFRPFPFLFGSLCRNVSILFLISDLILFMIIVPMLCPRKKPTMQCNAMMWCVRDVRQNLGAQTHPIRSYQEPIQWWWCTRQTKPLIEFPLKNATAPLVFSPFQVHQMFSHFNAQTQTNAHTTPNHAAANLHFILYSENHWRTIFSPIFFCFVVFIYFGFLLVANKQQRKKLNLKDVKRKREEESEHIQHK